jgi:hypothetical protein
MHIGALLSTHFANRICKMQIDANMPPCALLLIPLSAKWRFNKKEIQN